MDPEFEFTTDDLAGAVFEALGAASTCWENITAAGVFDSERALAIGHALMARIGELTRPNATAVSLGLASTRELLAELVARIELGTTTTPDGTLELGSVRFAARVGLAKATDETLDYRPIDDAEAIAKAIR